MARIRRTNSGIEIERESKLRLARKYWQVYVLMLPGIIYFIVFKLMPVWGLGIAFVDFKMKKGLLGSTFVGFKHFQTFFNSKNFLTIFRNTMAISLMDLFLAFPVPIILALLLNEVRHERYKRVVQSVIYMPHFMSWAVIAGLTFFMFSTDVGVVNKLNQALTGKVYPYLTTQRTFWWVLLGQSIWKEAGWGTIIYLAAISQVDPGLYEAAVMDGASRFQRVLHVTIPSIIPTLTVMFIMRLGRMLNISFDQVWMMGNDMVRTVSETFDTYAFRISLQQGNYSMGTAVGLCKSAVGLFLVVSSNWLIKKTGNEGMF